MNQNASEKFMKEMAEGLENPPSIQALRERSFSLFQNTRAASVELVDRSQRIATEWLNESERRLLQGVSELLREIDAKIHLRLSQLGADAREQTESEAAHPSTPRASASGSVEAQGAKTSAPNGGSKGAASSRASHAAAKEGEALLPLPGYDEMNAKAAIAAIADLDGELLEAIRAYEETTKNRATVLRAIEQRLAS